jgi:hypothetical protein
MDPPKKSIIQFSLPIFPDKLDLFNVSGQSLKRNESRSQEPGARIKMELYQVAIPTFEF